MGTALSRECMLFPFPILFSSVGLLSYIPNGTHLCQGRFPILRPPNISLLLLEADSSAEVGKAEFQFALLRYIDHLFRAGELVQQARALVALAEDPFPSPAPTW